MGTPKDIVYDCLLRSCKISSLTYDILAYELMFMSGANHKWNNEKTQS